MTPIKYHEGAEAELLNEIGYLGACPTLTVLLRRTIHDHLRRARPEKILNVFQRIHLRFFRACGLASGRTSFASLRRQWRTGSLTFERKGWDVASSPRSVGPRALSSSSRYRLRRFDRASGSACFGSFGTRSSTQWRRMVCSSWQWLTTAVGLVIGSVAPVVIHKSLYLVRSP